MKRVWTLPVFAAIVALDQAVKAWVTHNLPLYDTRPLLPPFVRLLHVRNEGASFNMLSGMRWLLTLIPALALAVAVWVVARKILTHPLALVGLAFVSGGAAGNLIDRLRFGYVVDMFEFEFVRFAIFNVADIFVTAGGVCVCVYLLFLHERKRNGDDGQPFPPDPELPGTESSEHA